MVPAFAIAVSSFDVLSEGGIHATLGVAIFAMVALQPILAIVRPHKGSSLRIVWYFTHWTLGMVAVALGWYNIYTGLQLYSEDWGTDTTVSDATMWQLEADKWRDSEACCL